MTTDYTSLSGLEMASAFRNGELSPVEVARAAIETSRLVAERFNAIASADNEIALGQAQASEARWKSGAALSPLDGVPVTFKDSFHVRGLPRWHGTACQPGAISSIDAAPVARAREAGMTIIAKTTMPDFALLMSGLSSQHGVIRNAWDAETSPGGSSSGAGTSVAAGVAPIAVGTDLIGSVRIPAALTGLASIKPTQGRIAYDPPGNYRSAGPMAKTVDDVDAMMAVLGREASVDFFALQGVYRQDRPILDDLSGKRIGVLRRICFGDPVDAATDAAVESQVARMAGLGAEIIDIEDLDASEADYDSIYWGMMFKAAPDYFAMQAEVRGRVQPYIGRMLDEVLPHSAMFSAQAARRVAAAAARIAIQLEPFDYILSPSLPVHAFSALGVSPTDASGVSHMGFACWFNQIGWPSATVPVLAGPRGGCPVSVQISGKRFDDAGVLQVARLLERERGFSIDFPGAHP
jgi:Asp-tRNA(Asn)/Glu-tRNA(Gln) amidotransferase A subunit family amidase